MTSFIVRDVPHSYIAPGAVMYLGSGGALPRVGDDVDSEPEEEERDVRHKEKEIRVSHGVNGTRRAVGGARTSTDKKSADSAYSSATMNDNDDRVSTSSSVPVDPSTQVPVFLSTSDMEFVVAGDSPDMRRVLTLYNPYDYAFDYRLYCTAPEHFEIKKPGPKVSAKHLVEFTIRGKSSLMPNTIHKIRVDIMRVGRSEIIGSKTVTIRAVTYPSQRAFGDQGGVFHRMAEDEMRREMTRGAGGRMGRANADVRIVNEPAPAPPFNFSVILLVSALCLLALCLPVQKDMTPSETIIPHYLHISETQRLCAAFLLGVCSVFILQPANR